MNLLRKTSASAAAIGALGGLALLMTAAPAAAESTRPASAPSGQVTRGEVLWMNRGCYLCHGTVGQGGVGPAVAVNLWPYLAVATFVRTPGGEMPPFSKKAVSDAELQDIHAYLSAQPQPKSPDSTPLLLKPLVSGR
jgi:ubiquinol-cytochrome c reductase cytochrome c subunit